MSQAGQQVNDTETGDRLSFNDIFVGLEVKREPGTPNIPYLKRKILEIE